MKVFILPYKFGSHSVKELVATLGAKRIKRVASRYIPKHKHLVINWGTKATVHPNQVNKAEAVAIASDKLATFKKLQASNVPTVDWTDSHSVAQDWLKENRHVFARKYLSACGGAGIVEMKALEDMVDAPLYTIYKKKKAEFRVHVVAGKVIAVQEKRRRKDYTGVIDNQIRNFDRGWVFCRDNITPPPMLKTTAVAAVKALGLDFGAVDIIWNEKDNQCYVLEVNTAPGLEGQTVVDYTNAFTKLKQERMNVSLTQGSV